MKLSAALALLGSGVYATLAERGLVASNNAVVSAYVVSLRAPIAGFVSGLAGGVGGKVRRGELMARLDDPYASDQHRADLEYHLARVRADRAAAEREHAVLTGLVTALDQRVGMYRDATHWRLASLIAGTEQALAAKLAEGEQTKRTLDRKRRLSVARFTAPADLEGAETAASIVAHEAEALTAQLASQHLQMNWASRGVMSDPATQDVTYSAQRADEVAIRLATLTREILVLRDDETETAERLAAETQRISLFRHAQISAPLNGTLWRLGVSDGERVMAGDLVAEIVDCSTAFLTVAVPQDRVPDIIPGGEVYFRLVGESAERKGRVETIMGATLSRAERHLAAVPAPERAATATVLVHIDAERGGCMVGRTARVRLPAEGRWFGHFFDSFL